MKISREDVLRVAELAHLDLSPEEIETYRSQLDEILNYVDKLKELDVTGIEPMTQVLPAETGLPAVVGLPPARASAPDAHPELREDVLRPCDVADAVLSSAPDAAKPFFRVPRVIGK